MKQAFVQETNIQLYKIKILEKLKYFKKLYSIKLENLNEINEFLDHPKTKIKTRRDKQSKKTHGKQDDQYKFHANQRTSFCSR